MLDVKEAARMASEYFAGLYANEGKSVNVQLEEVELSEDGTYWFITLSYPVASGIFTTPSPFNTKRDYKVFKIDAQTGQVISMKIRRVE